MNRAATLAALALLLAVPALAAEEPRGCDKFTLKIDSAQAVLTGPAESPGGAALPRPDDKAIALVLVPLAEAKLAMPPERAPKDPATFAGSVQFAAGSGPQALRVSLSAAAWIDVIQNGAYVKSGKFSGALDCPGIRKTVEFAVGAGPFTVQVSGASTPEIRLAVTLSE